MGKLIFFIFREKNENPLKIFLSNGTIKASYDCYINQIFMQTNILFFCRSLLITVLTILTVQGCVIFAQNQESACVSDSLASFPREIIPCASFGQSKLSFETSFQQDVSDYLNRAIVRNQLIDRAEMYLRSSENHSAEFAVENLVLVTEGLLDFGLTPDDPYLVALVGQLQDQVQKDVLNKSQSDRARFSLATRALQRYRQAFEEYRRSMAEYQPGRFAPLPPLDEKAPNVSLESDARFELIVAASKESLVRARDFLAIDFERPTLSQRRAAVVSGSACHTFDAEQMKLLANWETDNLRLTDVPSRLTNICAGQTGESLASTVSFALGAPGGQFSPNGQNLSILSSYSIVKNNNISSASLRSNRTQGFILFAQTIVLRV